MIMFFGLFMILLDIGINIEFDMDILNNRNGKQSCL